MKWILGALVVVALFDLCLFLSTRRAAHGQSAVATPTPSPLALLAPTSAPPGTGLVITPTTEATAPASPNDLLYIVDKQHTLSASYVPPDLVPLTTVRTTTPKQMVRRVVLPHLEKLIADAKAAGFELAVTSAYRSYSEQEATHAYWVRIEGEAAADRVSAQAGQSEHQLGLALDLTSAGAGFILSENFGSLPEGKWLRENAHRYGFIIRYPEGKESVTGYAYEPWHIRYVGEEAATAIFQQGITLDEYMRSKR